MRMARLLEDKMMTDLKSEIASIEFELKQDLEYDPWFDDNPELDKILDRKLADTDIWTGEYNG